MKDGSYKTRLLASGLASAGTLLIHENRAFGAAGSFGINGLLVDAPTHCVASFFIAGLPQEAGPSISTAHPVRLSGIATDTEFNVIGRDSSGTIIEIAGHWTAPLEDGTQ